MSAPRFIIRHLAFSGPNVEEARLDLGPGLNIVYGASNTGKSFTAKALNFMLAGTSKLPQTDEVKPFTAAWLGLTLPDGSDVTLYRSTKGGDFRLFKGLVSAEVGTPTDLLGSANADKQDTVSHVLLDAIGWSGKVIVRNGDAEKENLKIRHVLPYVIVSETDIMSEANPVHHSRQHTNRTLESNLLRFILTGHDGAAAVTVVGRREQRVANAAKLEIVDEWIAQIDGELGETPPDRKELSNQMTRLATTLGGLQDQLRAAQEQLDQLVAQRRSLLDQRREIEDRGGELALTLNRFTLLDQTYTNDLDRLQSLEESGFLLLARADRDCPVCGAPSNAQRHRHAPDEFGRAYRAAAAEVRKIRMEQRDLRRTMASLDAERSGLCTTAKRLWGEVQDIEKQIEEARPAETSLRSNFSATLEKQTELRRVEDLFLRRDRLVVRRSQIDSSKPKKREAKLSVGIDGPTAYALGRMVAEVLEAWKFPAAKEAQFDLETNDITIGGKVRADNGKGVRAILHAAFNVALLLYCREQKLPHPGFIVLDTPLLTYREPLTSRHGELSEDESRMKQAPVALSFYQHLSGLEDAQIIILENADPPEGLEGAASVQVFTGREGDNRYGLFPPAKRLS